eukprot:Rmarinus@m.3287
MSEQKSRLKWSDKGVDRCLEVVHVLGRGSFGTVSLARIIGTSELCVVKELDLCHIDIFEARRETEILRQLVHPHIVRYFGAKVDSQSSRYFTVMEYCSGGDLAEWIHKRRQAMELIDEGLIWSWVFQLASALEMVHKHKIYHRDIKPQNILLGSDDHIAKIGDFGLARMVSPNDLIRSNCGTPLYMAPEIWMNLPYDEKCDIWSLGCVLYELCALKVPFCASNRDMLRSEVLRSYPPSIPDEYSPELRRLIETMLLKDSDARPSATMILQSEGVKLQVERNHFLCLQRDIEEHHKQERQALERGHSENLKQLLFERKNVEHVLHDQEYSLQSRLRDAEDYLHRLDEDHKHQVSELKKTLQGLKDQKNRNCDK